MKFSHKRRSRVIVRRALSLIVLVSELSAQVGEHHVRVGLPQDWSHRHVIFNRSIVSAHPELANIEPRVLHQFLREMPRSPVTEAAPSNKQAHLKRDWMVAEIGASVAAGMSPAKFGFDASTTNCANDYVVFGLNALGATGGQGNLVALNNLYSGPSGLCGTGGPSLLFSYNTTTAGGMVKTSPVLSLDGTKIAFVESGTGVCVFHVLTWATGPGNGTSAKVSAAPGVGNTASMTSLTFDATASDTFSSPWVDYTNDVAYVGADDGTLYKINGVFKSTPVLAGAPWPIIVGAGGTGKRLNLTAPVLDQVTNNLFLGDERGNLWSINTVTPAAVKSLAIGKYGKLDPSVIDGPIVDVTNGTVFAVSADDGMSAVLVEADTITLAELARARIGEGSSGGTDVDIYDGALDNNYFNEPSTGTMLVCGTGAADATPWRYSFPFVGRVLQTIPTNSTQILSSTTSSCSPLTEFFNPNVGAEGTDFFFWGMTQDCPTAAGVPGVASGCVMSLTNFGAVTTVTEAGGTSVVITDNFSTAGQASSIYFTNFANPHNAVKLTQNGLN
jgi:hypothetical protein